MSSHLIAKRLLITASTLALLSACAVGPDFERPSAPDSTGYGAGLLGDAAEAEGVTQRFAPGEEIPADWWTLFHSEGLNKLIDQAVKDNPDLEAAKASLRAAEETAGATEGYLFPTIDAGFSSERKKTASASSGGNAPASLYNLHNASVSVSYGLDLFGGTRRAMEEADAQTEYKSFEVEAAYLTLTSNIVTTAVQEASLRGQIKATEEMIKAQQSRLGILRQQVGLGAVAETSALSEEALLEQTRATLPVLNGQLEQTRHQLSALIGQTPDKVMDATFDLSNLKLPEKLPVTLPVKLIEQRPDIRAAEANLHAASAEIGVRLANRLPGITLSANIGSQANDFSKLFMAGGGVWGLGASVAETIFDAGTLAHKQSAAEAEYDVARAQYRKTVLSALKEVADTLAVLRADAAALKSQKAALMAATRNLTLTDEQYKAGAVSYLSLLTAQKTKAETQQAFVQAAARRYADTAALYQALGGGWWNRATASQKSPNASEKP